MHTQTQKPAVVFSAPAAMLLQWLHVQQVRRVIEGTTYTRVI